MPLILDGRAVAASLRDELRAEVAQLQTQFNTTPRLDIVHVEGDAASDWYVRSIQRACRQIGMMVELTTLPSNVTQATLLEHIQRLNGQNETHGIIVQAPLPRHIDTTIITAALDPARDVDGQHPVSIGRLMQGLPSFIPNTPAGGMEMLRRYNISVAGKHAVVVGRSNVVGKPMAALLLQEDATVTIAHSRTPDLAAVVREADLVAVAVGRPGLIHGSMLKQGVVVIDFGINDVGEGRIVGDVDYESAAEVAGAITPVPGGTGPVTNLMLLRNVVNAARTRHA